MTLKDVMTKAVVTVDMDESLQRIGELFEESKFHHLLVTVEGKLMGVISDRDFLKNLSPFLGRSQMARQQDANTLQKKAHQLMTRRPATARPETPLRKAAQRMLKLRISCLPVVERDGRVVGIVTWRDLLRQAYPDLAETEQEAA